ncbi:MAG: M24 family metallopeptidase [Nocardioidaceae bacterium]
MMSSPMSSHASRRARLQSLARDRKCSAVLVSDVVNVRYLTGFTGSNAAVLVPVDGEPVFATDGRYTEQARVETELEPVLVKGDLAAELLRQAGVQAGGPVAVETHVLTHDTYSRLRELDPPVELVSASRAVEELRAVKDAAEVASLRAACEISTAALELLVSEPLVARSERELARRLEAYLLDLGAEAVGFDTILATGPHSSVPHHSPTDREVAVGDLLKIDFGARVDGYHADCTRTFVVGREPADWQREVHAAVESAQARGVAHARAGAKTKDVDAAVRASLSPTGYADRFVHGLGHGVGLQIHEDPQLGATTTGTLADRAVITIEPGVYLPGRGGVRIEDTLVVTDGAPEVLTTATKELRVVG